HQPVQAGQGQPLEPAAGRAHGRVLAEQEVPLDLLVDHVEDGPVGAVVAGDPGQVAEAEVVVGGGGAAEPGLEHADQVGALVAPEAGVRYLGEVLVHALARRRHGQVAAEQVEQGRDVGGALDVGVPAQGQDAAAGSAPGAQQHLEDGRGPDVLHPGGVLGPADRVHPAGGLVPAAGGDQGGGDPGEVGRADAADLLDHVGGVPGEVPPEHLEHAARVSQRLVPLAGRLPGGGGVGGGLRV